MTHTSMSQSSKTFIAFLSGDIKIPVGAISYLTCYKCGHVHLSYIVEIRVGGSRSLERPGNQIVQ